MTKPVRVRYAPSPTGHLHIGNARTAIFNYLFARRHGGSFVIRIEDTDQKRNVEGGEESQMRFLAWLGVDWDEGADKGGAYGPYRQTERLDLYEPYWQDLINRGLAYKCYCTEEELEKDREAQMAEGITPKYSGRCRHLDDAQREAMEQEGRQASVRFAVPEGRVFAFDDMVKGDVRFEASDFGDFVIVKKDGIPTYNFAVAVDDHLMEISHVLRGDDHITNTPRQLMVYDAFGWEPPQFGHMTLIVNEQKKKLSKRDQGVVYFIEQYRDLGYLPEALFNFITLLGWSPEGEDEIYSRDALVSRFDASRLSKSPAVFDRTKLNWMNGHYIKNAELARLTELALPHLQQAGRIAANPDEAAMAWVGELVSLYQDRLEYMAQIVELTDVFFQDALEYGDEAREVLSGEQVPEVIESFVRQLKTVEPFEPDQVKAVFKAVQKETGHKGKALFMPVRAALTGEVHGPDLNRTIVLLGREKAIGRLEAFNPAKL